MVRPFKVAFSDIQNHYRNTKNNNIMMEIITTVFNKSIEVEIPRISRCESFFNLLSSFSKNHNIFELKKFRN